MDEKIIRLSLEVSGENPSIQVVGELISLVGETLTIFYNTRNTGRYAPLFLVLALPRMGTL